MTAEIDRVPPCLSPSLRLFPVKRNGNDYQRMLLSDISGLLTQTVG